MNALNSMHGQSLVDTVDEVCESNKELRSESNLHNPIIDLSAARRPDLRSIFVQLRAEKNVSDFSATCSKAVVKAYACMR